MSFDKIFVQYMGNLAGNKKSEFMDHYVVIYGMITVMKRLGLFQQFNVIINLFDRNSLNLTQQLKNISFLLPNATIYF